MLCFLFSKKVDSNYFLFKYDALHKTKSPVTLTMTVSVLVSMIYHY